MQAPILNLLERALICHDRGQINMARAALHEAFSRAEEFGIDDDELWNRMVALDEKLGEPENTINDISGRVKCTHCNGTGKFSRTYTCMRCLGKGYQTDDDRARNERYELYRASELARKKASYEPNSFF